MIPKRVKLKGFLCYKEEQTIDFDGHATLWMLSGLNGSGKSAIFDAVTFALFGHHRGGGSQAVELVNKDSDSTLIEFDFLLDGQPYRAKRTLKRDNKGGAKGTQQLFHLQETKWQPIEDTQSATGYKDWVANKIGLNYDTFTSSVLLLQGKAEKLLDSRPEGRREVLARVVDLGRYEQMHKKADEQRKLLARDLERLDQQLAVLPAVAPLEIEAAKNRIVDAEEKRTQARAEVDRWREVQVLAGQWRDLNQRLAQARLKHQRAEHILKEAATIERAVERLRELREVRPRLYDIVMNRAEHHRAGDQMKRLETERGDQAEQLTQKEATLKQTHQKRTLVNGQLTRDEQRYREVAAQLQKLGVQMERLAQVERQEAELARLRQELSAFPPDPRHLVAEARAAHEQLQALGRVVPQLAKFQTRREELRQAQSKQESGKQEFDQVLAQGQQLKTEVEQLQEQVRQATQSAETASIQATEAKTLLQQAKESLRELSLLDGSKVCRHCGQELTAGHIQEEKKRRATAVRSAEDRAKQNEETWKAARAVLSDVQTRLTQREQARQEARDRYLEAKAATEAALQQVERCQLECRHQYDDLPEPYRKRIAVKPPTDWARTTWPRAEDVEEVRAQARGLDQAQKKLAQAEDTAKRYESQKARESQTLETLQTLSRDLPQDRQNLRREHKDLQTQEQALHKSLDTGRAQLATLDAEIERHTRARDAAQKQVAQTETRIKEEQLKQQNAERNIATNRKLLPLAWQPRSDTLGLRELSVLEAEQKQLEQEGTDDQARELAHARLNQEVLRQDMNRLESEQERFAPEARQEPAQIEAKLQEARRQDRACDEELSEARQLLSMLENQRNQREELSCQAKELDREATNQRLLAELLGREHLQLYLVRQAERQVVEYANAVLDRLSGGQLYLKLAGEASGDGQTAKALELEAYNRATGDRPINVTFLSGSQKFRVAVSLALGIGQYASKQHRPIESVIIDEGFGCLDSQGRQVMIQELQNLRSQMRCILLVSHQEDFAEAFNDGYQFKLENGATRVQRFQK